MERGFPSGSVGKESACSAEDPGSVPGLGRSPGEGNGNPLQCSCLENSSTCHLFRKLTYQSNNEYVSDKAKVLLKFQQRDYDDFFLYVCAQIRQFFFFPFNLKKNSLLLFFNTTNILYRV